MIRRQIFLFACVGIISALIDIAIMQTLIHLELHYALATSVGFAGGLIANYILHSKLTFKAPTSLSSMVKFGAVVFLNYCITLIFVYSSQQWLGGAMIGKIASLPVIAGNGFLLSKYWVFR